MAIAIIRGKEEPYPVKFCVFSPEGLKLLRKTKSTRFRPHKSAVKIG